MKVPVSWLSQYFEAPVDAYRVADRLTLAGVEVERVQGVAETPARPKRRRDRYAAVAGWRAQPETVMRCISRRSP